MITGSPFPDVRDLMARQRLDDEAFDAIYPPPVRALSSRFWTPVAVGRRAAGWFQQAGARRVLDVGAGVGKFVLAAAATAPDLRVVGIEQRSHLVSIALRAKARLGITNASFKLVDAALLTWTPYDGIYFFNPFEENLMADVDCIDHRVELSRLRFIRDVRHTHKALRAAPIGTAVVTYCGMGGPMPAGYRLVCSEPAESGYLELWRKTSESNSEPGT